MNRHARELLAAVDELVKQRTATGRLFDAGEVRVTEAARQAARRQRTTPEALVDRMARGELVQDRSCPGNVEMLLGGCDEGRNGERVLFQSFGKVWVSVDLRRGLTFVETESEWDRRHDRGAA